MSLELRAWTPWRSRTPSVRFALRAQLSGLFEKIGVNTEFYKKGPHADFDFIDRPATDEDRERDPDRCCELRKVAPLA